jgi:hypothetical protein
MQTHFVAANCAMKVMQNLRSGIHKVVEVGNQRRFAATFAGNKMLRHARSSTVRLIQTGGND